MNLDDFGPEVPYLIGSSNRIKVLLTPFPAAMFFICDSHSCKPDVAVALAVPDVQCHPVVRGAGLMLVEART